MHRVLYCLATMFLLVACGQSQPLVVASTATTLANTAVPTLTPTDEPSIVPTLRPTFVIPSATATGLPSPTASSTPTAVPTPTATLEPTPTSPAKPLAATPQYVFPVEAAKYSVSSSHHDYPAADIACPIGSKFLAVTSGIVDSVSSEDLWPTTGKPEDKGGLSVAIVGDDGVRYYGSHLSEIAKGIKPGVRVEAGQVLGLTGESGNAKGVYPQLHFGISHPTTPDDWQVRRGEIWPQKYLKAWEKGTNLTPKL